MIASSLVLVLYALDMVASRWRIPSVLVLISAGVLTSQGLELFGVLVPSLRAALPILGLVGLAMVVLEGALELRWKPGRGRRLVRAIAAAILGIVLFTLLVGWALHSLEELPWRLAFLNAMPLAIISSAIAIPSATNLGEDDREFVSVESSVSDIFGVLAFNALVVPVPLGPVIAFRLGWNAVLTLVLSAVVCLGLLHLLGRSQHKVKFFPLLAALLLCFSLGKFFHLSSLLLLLVFGLYLANIRSIPAGPLRDRLVYPHFGQDIHLLETVVQETTFIARTFFFFLFGVTLDLLRLTRISAWIAGGSILSLIYLSRWFTLRGSLGKVPRSLLFLAPRGLISIILYGGIPESERSSILGPGVLLVVILGTSLLQIFAGRSVAESAGMPASLLERINPGRTSEGS